MADDRSEEFRKFILENREIIESILNEEKEASKKAERIVSEKVDDAKEKAKDFNDTILRIMTDENVQKHFFTGCLELLHFLEAVIEAAPLSPEVRDTVSKYEAARDTTIRNIVMTGAKDRMDNIPADEPKKPSSGTKKKGKTQSIPVNDISGKKKSS